MFGPEDLWTSALDLNQNITLPGLSPLYPNVTCDSEGSVCHVITGEAEINAACTMTVSCRNRLPSQSPHQVGCQVRLMEDQYDLPRGVSLIGADGLSTAGRPILLRL